MLSILFKWICMEIFVFKNFDLNKNYYEKFLYKKRKCIGIKGELFIELFI